MALDGADGVDVSVLVEMDEESWNVLASRETLEDNFLEGGILVVLVSVPVREDWSVVDLFGEDCP